jgi:rRNA maturation protein Nop10
MPIPAALGPPQDRHGQEVRMRETCEHCGTEFELPISIRGSVEDIRFIGNTAECPNCGHVTPIQDRIIKKVKRGKEPGR